MNLDFPLLLTLAVAILGWYAVHAFAMYRDRAAKRRDLRIQYLIEAYRRLELASSRPLKKETAQALESALADIQLFGSTKQVTLASEFASAFAKHARPPIQPLIVDLRDDLRRELRLQELRETPKALRIRLDDEDLEEDV